ncbi:MAG TPA: hypothetical protein VF599_10425 [Pyrinomonadaceae bacterium]|jgi:hypothetical protein
MANEAEKNNALPLKDKGGQNTLIVNTASSEARKRRLTPEHEKMILKTIDIRLEGIGEAAKRSRITFVISIIACCSMLITIYNAYFSFTRQRGFDDSFKYQAVEIVDEEKFVERIKNERGENILVKYFDELNKCETLEKESICNERDYLIKHYERYKKDYQEYKIRILSEPELKQKILEPDLKEFRKKSLKLINEHFLNSKELYKKISGEDFYNLFHDINDDECVKEENKAQSGKHCKKIDKKTEGENLQTKIKQNIFGGETPHYYNAVNHLNKLIIDRCFPEIVWKAKVLNIENPIPIYEENKRALSREWIENQNVRIELLGISVNVDQFSLIGSITLTVISIWMLFSFRRENRSIVSLLRDIKKEVEKPDGVKENSDVWDIANLTLHGIAHKLIFSQTGRNDLPMSERNIFDDPLIVWKNNINNIVELITKLIRLISYLLLLLPVGSIIAILYYDKWTTTEIIYPYSNNPVEYFINRNIKPVSDLINGEIYVGVICAGITLLVCLSCMVFQISTGWALKRFEKELGKPRYSDDSWWENYWRANTIENSQPKKLK